MQATATADECLKALGDGSVDLWRRIDFVVRRIPERHQRLFMADTADRALSRLSVPPAESVDAAHAAWLLAEGMMSVADARPVRDAAWRVARETDRLDAAWCPWREAAWVAVRAVCLDAHLVTYSALAAACDAESAALAGVRIADAAAVVDAEFGAQIAELCRLIRWYGI